MPSKAIAIPAELMLQHVALRKIEDEAHSEAGRQFNLLVGPNDDDLRPGLDRLTDALGRMRQARRDQAEMLVRWGREFMFGPKQVYMIDPKHNVVKVNLSLT